MDVCCWIFLCKKLFPDIDCLVSSMSARPPVSKRKIYPVIRKARPALTGL